MIKEIRRQNGTLDIQTINEEPSLAQQQFQEETDINNIMARYYKTGEFAVPIKKGQYADLTQIKDYQAMLNTVIEAEEQFMALPAQIRSRFENDPSKLISFLQDDKNYDEGVKLGLVEKKQPQPPKNEQIQTNETKEAKT